MPIQNTCRMSDGWSLRRICEKDLGMRDFLYILTVLVVYAMVSLQCLKIIPRQNTRGLFMDIQYFLNVSMKFFPKSDLAHWSRRRDVQGVKLIAPNTGANGPKFFTLATKSWKLVAKLATRTFHHNLTKRYSELKRFAKINPRQISSLSLFPKRSTCISIDN